MPLDFALFHYLSIRERLDAHAMTFLTPLFLLGLAALAVPVLIHLTQRERTHGGGVPVADVPAQDSLRVGEAPAHARLAAAGAAGGGAGAHRRGVRAAVPARLGARRPPAAAPARSWCCSIAPTAWAPATCGRGPSRRRAQAVQSLAGARSGVAGAVLHRRRAGAALERRRLARASPRSIAAQPSRRGHPLRPGAEGGVEHRSPSRRCRARRPCWSPTSSATAGSPTRRSGCRPAARSRRWRSSRRREPICRWRRCRVQRVPFEGPGARRGHRRRHATAAPKPATTSRVDLEVDGRVVQSRQSTSPPPAPASHVFAPVTLPPAGLRAVTRASRRRAGRRQRLPLRARASPGPCRCCWPAPATRGDRDPYLTRALAIGDAPRFEVSAAHGSTPCPPRRWRGPAWSIAPRPRRSATRLLARLKTSSKGGGGVICRAGRRADAAARPTGCRGRWPSVEDRTRGAAAEAERLRLRPRHLRAVPRAAQRRLLDARGSTAIRVLTARPDARDAGPLRRRARRRWSRARWAAGGCWCWATTPRPVVERPGAQAGLPAVRPPDGAAGSGYRGAAGLGHRGPGASNRREAGAATACCRPAGQRVPPTRQAAPRWRWPRPGFYEVRGARDGQRCAVVAANVDLTESDPARVDPAEVTVAVTGRPGRGGPDRPAASRPGRGPGAGATHLVVPAVRRYPASDRRIVAGAAGCRRRDCSRRNETRTRKEGPVMDDYARAELVAVIRQVRTRWRSKLAVRGGRRLLVAGVLAIFALAAALGHFRFTPAAIFWLPLRHRRGARWAWRRGSSRRPLLRQVSATSRWRCTSRSTSRRSEHDLSPRWPSPATGQPRRRWCSGWSRGGRRAARTSTTAADRTQPLRQLQHGRGRGLAVALLPSSRSVRRYLRQALSAMFVLSRSVEAAAPYRIALTPGNGTVPQRRRPGVRRHAQRLRRGRRRRRASRRATRVATSASRC